MRDLEFYPYTEIYSAPFYNLPADYFFLISTQKELAARDNSIHSSIQPYIPFFSYKYSINSIIHNAKRNEVINSLFYEDVLRVKSKDEDEKRFYLRLDPLLNLEFGRDRESTTPQQNLYTNTRGFIGSGSVGSKVYFETMFAENQSLFPDYIATAAKNSSVVPGQGRWKDYKKTGFDYAFSSGFVSVQAFKNVNVQVGHGKQKIGNGYRSLLLSDNSFNYPYARITQQWFKGRLQYTNIYAVLMNLTSASAIINPNVERLWQKKAASFQYLSVNPTKWLNIGFFQGLIWQPADERNKQHLSWQYFNPVIYTNLPEYGLNNRNNILIGADLKIKLTNKFNVYGQVMLDNLKDTRYLIPSNGYGGQAGFNYFDAFGIKNLFLQMEYNEVHQSSVIPIAPNQPIPEAYTHYGQSLAYTNTTLLYKNSLQWFGYYTQEIIFIAAYKWKRFFVNAKYNYINIDPPLAASFGYGASIINTKIGYTINPAYNLNIALGMNYRTGYNRNPAIPQSLQAEKTNYIYIALRTNLYNLYYDF
ncbi:MAG: hypothetical protein KF900_01815 [Bacteroidetes bacterium]|nr:hypothetical protein [Bacteroidota bacterium]